MKTFVVVLLSAVLFVLPACTKKEEPKASLPGRAPDFRLSDTAGRPVRLADFSGRIVVLDFWATWCPPCRETTRELEALQKRFRSRGVVILGISMDSESSAAEKVKEFAARHRLTYRMLLDDGKASKAYGVRTIPSTFILDRDHRIVKSYPGYLPHLGNRIADHIRTLLKKK